MGKVIKMKRATPSPTNRELPLAPGCVYVTGFGHKGKEAFKIFCHKLVQPGSQYCPKHALYVADEGQEPERRRLQRKANKEYRKVELEALALSPLKADNFSYTEPIEGTGYEPVPERGKQNA